MSQQDSKWTRRQMIKAGSVSLLGGSSLLSPFGMHAIGSGKDKKYLFVFCGLGGAAINESFLATSKGPTGYGSEVEQVRGTPFSAVKPQEHSIVGRIPMGNGYAQKTFVTKHHQNMVVMCHEVSSVNHQIASKRAVTGDNINSGRTIQEAVAHDFGGSCIIPNMSLAGAEYGEAGTDYRLPDVARPEQIADSLMLAFATHGFKGLRQPVTSSEMAEIRKLRFALEKVSRFGDRYGSTDIVRNYVINRENLVESIEAGNLVTKLNVTKNTSSSFDLQLSPDFSKVIEVFPNLHKDPLEANAAMAYLLTKNSISNAVTIAPRRSALLEASGTPNAPIGFDWSHRDHRGGQHVMWSYILKSMDGLITLLKTTDVDGDPSKGKMWDRSFIYLATEFGRDKVKSGGSGHNMNNGSLMISPMLKGNQVFGGIDQSTGLTYGFDPNTGAPNRSAKLGREGDVYSVIAQAFGIEFKKRRDKPAMMG